MNETHGGENEELCEACGNEVGDDAWYVGNHTPAWSQLRLPETESEHTVCDECYNRTVAEIANTSD